MAALLHLALAGDGDVRVAVPLSIAGVPFTVNLVNPGSRTERHRIPEIRAMLSSNPGLVSSLPRSCGGMELFGDAEINCWADIAAYQIESTLVGHELATLEGRYWNLRGFYRGRAYSNEVNRMITNVVAKVRAP